jgi:hypothetical protein
MRKQSDRTSDVPLIYKVGREMTNGRMKEGNQII